MSQDDDIDLEHVPDKKPSLLAELLVPILLLVGVGVWTLQATGSVKIVEAFLLADTYLFIILTLRGRLENIAAIGDVIMDGAKSVTPALLIVALAYSLNSVTTSLGAADVIIDLFADSLSPNSVVALTFVITAAISFSTGTSWGAYALMFPVALPLAFQYSGGELAPLIYQTVAAIAGGGIFGDHASPVSDTTVLSSVGAGSDHIDHVVTQLPYALVVASVTVVIYLLL